MHLPLGNYGPLDTFCRLWPIGSVYLSVVNTDPAELFGFGTWQLFGAGRAIVGVDIADPDFDAAEKTSGSKTHTLTAAEMPSHTHTQNAHNHTQDPHTHVQNAHQHTAMTASNTAGTSGASITRGSGTQATVVTTNATAVNQNATATNQAATAVNQNTGGGGAHPIVQPSIAIFMWKRVG